MSEELSNLFARHQTVALLYSGGRDSAACLLLCEPWLPQLLVIWVDTGENFPEIVEHMHELSSRVRFIRIVTNQAANLAQFGYPSDIIPARNTAVAQALLGKPGIRVQHYLDCCGANIYFPGYAATKESGATAVIRGHREVEAHKAGLTHGQTFDGLEYCFPIRSYSDGDLVALFERTGYPTPDRFSFPHSSLDCRNCTAYLGDSTERLKYVKFHYPHDFERVRILNTRITQAIDEAAAERLRYLEV